MEIKKGYLDYCLQLDNKVVILSDNLAELLEIDHEVLISEVKKKHSEFENCVFSVDKNKLGIAKIKKSDQEMIIAFTERGVAKLSEVFINKINLMTIRNIIDAMVEMESLIENSNLESETNWLLHKKVESIPKMQKRLEELLQKEFQKDPSKLFEDLSQKEKERFGLA